VALTGATPVFVDIDPRTFNVDPDKIELAISNRTRAIQVVHLFGLPADMSKIARIAEKYNLFLVEDAAQAHLASIDKKAVGTFGNAAAFSFYPTKNMTSGEGGMAVFADSEHARTARLLRNQGMETRYQNEIVGMNLRMTEIHAAIGIEQLKKVVKWTAIRQSNANFLTQNLHGVQTPITPPAFEHVYHQYTIRYRQRDWLMGNLRKLGIGCEIYYPTQVHQLPPFKSGVDLPETRLATLQVLSIPVHPSLSRRDLKKIAMTVNYLVESNK
jgi:dTDP-4-amino-4,6-dideoxygalactose transaminase